MGIHRIKGLSTTRCWYCALGFGIALVTMGAIFWIAWCYFGLSVVQVTESQRRAIVDYSYTTPKPSSTTSRTKGTTIPSVVKDGTSIESSLNTISRTVTESTFSRGSSKGDSPLNLKLQKKKEEESILSTQSAKGDFASRNRTPSNAAPAVEPASTVIDKGHPLPHVRKEETTAISNNDGLRARSPPNSENRPSFEESSSKSSSGSLSTGTEFSSRDDGSNRNHERPTSKDVLDSAGTSSQVDEKIQSSRSRNADSTTRTLDIENLPSDTRRTRNDEESYSRKQDDRIERDPTRQNDDRNHPSQFNDRDLRRPDDDRSSVRRYDEENRSPISKRFEDDEALSRRYEDDDRDLPRRYEDDDRGLPRRYADDDRGLPRRYVDDRGLPRQYEDKARSPSRGYDDDVRGVPRRNDADRRPIIRDEDADRRPIRRYEDTDRRPMIRDEDDDRRQIRRHEDTDRRPMIRDEDEDRRPIRRYEDTDRRPIIRDEDDDRRPTRRYEDTDRRPIITDEDAERRPVRRYEDDDRRPIRRYEDDDRRPIRRYEDDNRRPTRRNEDDIRPIRRYEDDGKESSRRHDDRFSKGDFNTKPSLIEPKIEESRHPVETKLRGDEERYRDRDYDPRYRNREHRYRDEDIRNRYAKDDPRYESRPIKDESTYEDQYKSSKEPYPPRHEDRDPLIKGIDETISLDRKYVSKPDTIRGGGRPDSISLNDQYMKTFPSVRNDRVDSSTRDDRFVREHSYANDRNADSSIIDDRETRRLNFGATDDRNKRQPDSTLKDNRRVSEGTDDDRYRYRPSDLNDNSGTIRGTSIDDRYFTRDDQYRSSSRYDKTDRILPTRVRDGLDLTTEDRYNGRTRHDEKDKIVPTKVRGEIYTSRSTVDTSRHLPSDERKKDERVLGTRYDERNTEDTRELSPTIIESSRTRDDSFRTVESGDKVILDRRSYASEDEYRRSNSRTRPPYYDDDEYRRPSRTNADEHRTRKRDDDDGYDREYHRDRDDGFYDRSDERSNRRTYETPRTRDKDAIDLSSSESVNKERRGQIPSRYPEGAANPDLSQIDRRYADDVPRTPIKHDGYDRSPIHRATDSEEVSRNKRFQQPQSDRRYLPAGIEGTDGSRSESSHERPVNAKDVIEAALRQSDTSDHNPKNVFYPVFDPRMSNLTSPDIIRPSERRGTTILSRRKR